MSDLSFSVAFGPAVVRITASPEEADVHHALRKWFDTGRPEPDGVPDLVLELVAGAGMPAASAGGGAGSARVVTGTVAGDGSAGDQAVVEWVTLWDGRAWEAATPLDAPADAPRRWRLARRDGPLFRTAGRLPTWLFRFLHVHRFSQAEARASTLIYRHLIPAVQEVLLDRSATFVHASALRGPDGRGLLGAGWGGAGKTRGSAALYMRSPEQWRFMSDDLAILSADGALHFSPIPLNIFPYSTRQFPPLHQRVVRPMGWWDRLQWWARGTVVGRKGVARRIPVMHDLASHDSCTLAVAAHFQRSAAPAIHIRHWDVEQFARVSGSVLLYELRSSLPMYAAAAALALDHKLPFRTIDALAAGAGTVIADALADVRVLRVDVPEGTTVPELGSILEDAWQARMDADAMRTGSPRVDDR